MPVLLLPLFALSGQGPDQGFYTPFSPQETLNVELIATWSDGDTSTSGLSVAAKDGYVYMAGGDGLGLKLLDARWPKDSGVKEVAVIETLRCRGVLREDTLLYAGVWGLSVYNIVDADSLILVGRSLKGPDRSKAGTVCYLTRDSSGYLYITFSDYGNILIYDISNLDSIYLVGSFLPSFPPSARQVAFTPPCYLYTASWGAIYILDVSDPSNPVCVDSFGIDGGWECIETEGNLLVATSGNVAYAYDISDPVNPALLESGLVRGWVQDILMRRNNGGRRLLYTSNFEVFDVTDGSNPVLVGEWTNPPYDGPTTLFWDRGYTYVSSRGSYADLWILHYLGDTIIPPDTGDTSEHYLDWMRTVYGPPGLEFSLNKEANVSFSLFNAAGLKAFEKNLGLLEPGLHIVGLPHLRPGVYFIHMRANEESLFERLVFTK